MTDVYTDTLAQEEAAAYQSRATGSKFKQLVAYGIGAATVFGLVGAISNAIIYPLLHGTVALTFATAIGPVLGLAAIAALGVSCLYLSAKYLSENTLHDQELQAKQISCATRGHAPAVEPIVAPKMQELPETSASKVETLPATIIGNERELADTVVPRTAAKGVTNATTSWTQQVEQNNDIVNQSSRAA